MADFRDDVNRRAQHLTRLAQEAGYVAVGLGIVGFQRAQVLRRDLTGGTRRPARPAVGELQRAWRQLDRALGGIIELTDAQLEPVAEHLPGGARELVRQAQQGRDGLRRFLNDRLGG